MNEYWQISLEEIFEQNGIQMDEEIFESIVKDVSSAHEMYSESTGIASTEQITRKEVKDSFKLDDVHTCPACHGKGRKVNFLPCHVTYQDCSKCNGRGFLVY